MRALVLLFWVCFFIVFYSYFGYALILFCFISLKKLFFRNNVPYNTSWQPEVALVIPAYNEEDVIERKINNTLDLNYPKDKLSVIFITDGSTDSTRQILSNYDFMLMHQPERKGKSAAMNRAMQIVKAPVVIFCDANTLLNRDCIKEIVKHYADPKVGGVAGEKKIVPGSDYTPVSSGEGIYWKYESFLKRMDSQFYSVVGAAGELFSFRTKLYQVMDENIIIEDFVLSLLICLKGYIIRYEPKAYAMESASISMKEEQKRKVRISAGAFQAMFLLKPLFNIFRYPMLSFQFISHRVLRWTFCPICLLTMLIANLLLVFFSENTWYLFLFLMQLTFYLLACIGWILNFRKIKYKFLHIPYYFLFMNVSVILGLYRLTTHSQSVLWEKVRRQKLP